MSSRSEPHARKPKRRASQSGEDQQRKKARLSKSDDGVHQDEQSRAAETTSKNAAGTATPQHSQEDVAETQSPEESASNHCATQVLNILMILMGGRQYTDFVKAQIADAKASESVPIEKEQENIASLERKLAIIGKQQQQRIDRLITLVDDNQLSLYDPNLYMLPVSWFHSVKALAEQRDQIERMEVRLGLLLSQLEHQNKAWESAFNVARTPDVTNSPRVHISNILDRVRDPNLHQAVEEAMDTVNEADDRLVWLRGRNIEMTDQVISEAKARFIDARLFPRAQTSEIRSDTNDDQQHVETSGYQPEPLKDKLVRNAQDNLADACRELKDAYKAFDKVRTRHKGRASEIGTEYDLQYFLNRADANRRVVQAKADMERRRNIAQALGALPADQITSGFNDRSDDGYAESLVEYIQDQLDKDRVTTWLMQQPDGIAESLCNANTDAHLDQREVAVFQSSLVGSEEWTYCKSLKRKLDAYKRQQEQWRKEATDQYATWQAYQCLAPPLS